MITLSKQRTQEHKILSELRHDWIIQIKVL